MSAKRWPKKVVDEYDADQGGFKLVSRYYCLYCTCRHTPLFGVPASTAESSEGCCSSLNCPSPGNFLSTQQRFLGLYYGGKTRSHVAPWLHMLACQFLGIP